mmetsp:Transcript_103270/g.301264  ORF Transcript_103270/g.301264 Transcript_103270/m.301264 type:complete len:328 (+) Transcript_103270:921-1904(+)
MRTLCGMRLVSMNSDSWSRSVSLTSNLLCFLDSSRSKSSIEVPLAFMLSCQEVMSQTSPPLTAWHASCASSPIMDFKGTPLSERSILLTSQMARTSMCSRLTSDMAGSLGLRSPALWNCANWRRSSVPTLPLPMIPTATVMSESVKPACAERSARERSAWGTTAEMLRSEEPWAMAMMLTLALPKELKNWPLMPVRLFMPSPTTATILQPARELTRHSWLLASSSAKACSTLCIATPRSFSSTATVMECSEEPWEARMTFTPVLPRASIIFLATPGVPRKDAPEMVRRATFSMDVIAFTGNTSSSSSSSWSGHRSQSSPRPYTRVPG